MLQALHAVGTGGGSSGPIHAEISLDGLALSGILPISSSSPEIDSVRFSRALVHLTTVGWRTVSLRLSQKSTAYASVWRLPGNGMKVVKSGSRHTRSRYSSKIRMSGRRPTSSGCLSERPRAVPCDS